MNNIAKTSKMKQLRYIYNKVDGYRYILVHDHEIDSDLSQIRISRRFNNQATSPSWYTPMIPQQGMIPPNNQATSPSCYTPMIPPICYTPMIPPPNQPSLNHTPMIISQGMLPPPYKASSTTTTIIEKDMVSAVLFPDRSKNEQHIQIYVSDEQLSGVTSPSNPTSITVHLPYSYQSYAHHFNLKFAFGSPAHEQRHNVERINTVDEKIICKGNKMDSPEALFLFFGKTRAKEISSSKIDDTSSHRDILRAHIMDQVEKLQNVNLYIEGWKFVVRRSVCFSNYTDLQIQTLRHRSTYLAMVYYLCLDHYDNCNDFTEIVQMAIDKTNHAHLNDFLPKHTNNPSTFIVHSNRIVKQWFREYRNTDFFANYSPLVKHNKLPPLLNANPDLLNGLISYCRKHINTLSVELVHDFLHTKALPDLTSIIMKEQGKEYSTEQLMLDFGLKKLSCSTVQKWMNRIGFKYEPRRKTYYVDSHETPANVKYREYFIERYFGYELLAHRWYTISLEERNKLVDDGTISAKLGYKYEIDGTIFMNFMLTTPPFSNLHVTRFYLEAIYL